MTEQIPYLCTCVSSIHTILPSFWTIPSMIILAERCCTKILITSRSFFSTAFFLPVSPLLNKPKKNRHIIKLTLAHNRKFGKLKNTWRKTKAAIITPSGDNNLVYFFPVCLPILIHNIHIFHFQIIPYLAYVTLYQDIN